MRPPSRFPVRALLAVGAVLAVLLAGIVFRRASSSAAPATPVRSMDHRTEHVERRLGRPEQQVRRALETPPGVPAPPEENAARSGSVDSRVPVAPAPTPTPAPAPTPIPIPSGPNSGLALRNFEVWLDRYRGGIDPADPTGASPGLAEGLALARERRLAMRSLILENPRAALAAALAWEDRQGLPESILAELEAPFAGKGDLEVLCAWQVPGRSVRGSSYSRTFTVAGQRYAAFVAGRRLVQSSARGIALHGIVLDDAFAVADEPLRILGAAEATDAHRRGMAKDGAPCAVTGRPARMLAAHGDQLVPLADESAARTLARALAAAEPGFRRALEPPSFSQWSHGTKRLLYMRVRFPDDVREPIGEAEASDVMRLANDYFASVSFNNLALISTTGPLVTLPQPKLYYAVRGASALLTDARAATREAGFEPDVFDLDVVRHENVPGFDWGGLGSVGGKGVWLQSSSLAVVCHELGHNLGLAHANFWNTVRPELPDNPQNLPFDTDGLVGIDSVIGPGDDVEYGDPFDVMGSGGDASAHFTGLHKYLLGWLPEASVTTVTTSGVYRVYAHDAGVMNGEATHVLRVRKDTERQYWIDARSRREDNAWLSRGVELHWNQWHQAIASCQLLDTTPGTRHGTTDAALTVGRMFTDEAARVHVTPLRRGFGFLGRVSVPYYDVAIRFEDASANSPPDLALEATATAVGVNESVTFDAAATDADGDEVAFSWDLGDGLPGDNVARLSRSWDRAGDYVVRCEASDGRGGRAARHVAVRVGGGGGLQIQGRVLDQTGRPLLGVRVHNGAAGTNGPYAPEYRWAFTDTDGRYTLAGLRPGSYEVGAVLYGYDIRPLNFSRPLILNRFVGVDVDFIAAALPRVSVSPVADGDESGGRPVEFRVSRSHGTNAPLRIYFRTGGRAEPDKDYETWSATETQTNVIPTVLDPVDQDLELSFVDLGPGLLSTNLVFPVRPDAESEGDESMSLTLGYPVTRTVITETETNIFDIPGWEILADNGRDAWFQTRPPYQLGPLAEATVKIRDDGPEPRTSVAILALERVVSENAGDSATFLVMRTGSVPSLPLVVPLMVSGSATAGDDYVPLPALVTLPPELEAVRVTVRVLDDRFVEGNESITVALANGDGYVVSGRSATVTLVDNDLPWVSVAVVDSAVSESAVGARVTFQRTGDLGQPLEVDYLVGGTATAGVDYAALPGRVLVPAGAAMVTLEIVPLDDDQLEGDETVDVRVGDSPIYNVVVPGQATLTILDDEYPTLAVEAVDDVATEGNDDPGVWLIRRTGSTAERLEVRYRFGGNAQHQTDFIAIGDRLEIPAGQTAVRLVATPIDDAIREDSETIAIELLDGAGYRLGTPSRAGVRLDDNDDSELAVGFALLSSRGPEARSDPELVVRISGNPDDGPENAVTVGWEVLGGAATLGEDYVVTNGTLVFRYEDPEGETPFANRVGTIPLQILDDSLLEPDETLLVRLRIAPTEIPSEDPDAPPNLVTNGLLDVFTVHTYTIVDDDAAEITVVTEPGATAEGAAEPGVFVIRRTGRTNLTQKVTFDLSGLATPGSDYLEVARTATFMPGQSRVEVAVVPIDDPVEEYRENVRLTLVSAPGARLGLTRFTDIQIDDNDGTIEFAAARWGTSERNREARVEVHRSGDTNLTMTVLFDMGGGTATPARSVGETVTGDYWQTNGVLVFGPGERRKEFAVRVVDDREIEDTETVELFLSRGSGLFPLGGQNRAVLSILDDDALVGTGTNEIAEIESRIEWVGELERTGPVDEPLVVDYQTRDRTAVAGRDYVASSGSVVFGPGERDAVVRIPLLDDRLLENTEEFEILLTRITGEPVGRVVAAIVDDDCRVEFEAESVEVDEDAVVVEVAVRRIGSPLNPVDVGFQAVGGTASEGLDFGTTRGTLRFEGNRFVVLTNGTGEVVFQEGEVRRVFTIPILNDSEGEPDEHFRVDLTSVRSGLASESTAFVSLGTRTNLMVRIRDNEAPGHVDEGFHPGTGADATVRTLHVQSDGKILVGGDFETFGGVVLPRLARLHADGYLDRSFNPGRGFDGRVLAVAESQDGRLWVGGTFAWFDGAIRPFLVRLEPDGTRTEIGQLSVDGPVLAMAGGLSNSTYIGGSFARVNERTRGGVARLVGEGELDGEFVPEGAGGSDIRALARAQDGGVWVGGGFRNWSGSGRRYLVRLGADGRWDRAIPEAFSPDGPVSALASAADGAVFVTGAFGSVGGLPRAGIARLLPGGAADPGFDPGSGGNGPVLAVAAGRDGRPMLGGGFEAFGGVSAGRFARLNGNGLLDTSFLRGSGANDAVHALAVQPNGAILLGGDFTSFNGQPRLRVARIHAEERYELGFVALSSPGPEFPEAAGIIEVVVIRVGSDKAEAQVDYRTENLTAEAGSDYEPASGRLVFAPGEKTALIRVRLLDDFAAEGFETFRMVLEQPTGTALGPNAVAILGIVDDEPAVGWERTEVEFPENGGSVRVRLRRSGPLTHSLGVRVSTREGSALEGGDFEGFIRDVLMESGVDSVEIQVAIRDDAQVEGTETFDLVLSVPSAGIALGSQSVVRVRIADDDRLPTDFLLTVTASPGGTVAPGSGRFPVEALVTLTAIPDRGFEFARWEGTLASAENPLPLRMDRNHVVSARFRPRNFTETFESGGWGTLPWAQGGDTPWILVRETASSGEWSVRSGNVSGGGTSTLRLEVETPAGGGSFDFRTESEAGWDFLEFWVNGARQERWSGVNGWQTYLFRLPAGRNLLEWRWTRDRTFGGTLDAVWMDNLDLPERNEAPTAPRIRWLGKSGGSGGSGGGSGSFGCEIEVSTQPGRTYFLEASVDLRAWRAIDNAPAASDRLTLRDADCGVGSFRYYRVRAE